MASSDQDPEIEKRNAEAFERLLAEALSPSGARKADCPDAETLAAFYERALAPAETAHWRGHFAGCSRCQQALAAMAASDPNPLAEEEVAHLGELVAAVSAPPVAVPRPRTLKWPWFLDPRSLAPLVAAAVLILALMATLNSPNELPLDERTGAALNYQFALTPPTSQPIIAENKSAPPSPAPSAPVATRRAMQAPAQNAAPVLAPQPAPLPAPTAIAQPATASDQQRAAAAQPAAPQQSQTATAESAEETVTVAPAQMRPTAEAPNDSGAAANAPGSARAGSAGGVAGGAMGGMMAGNSPHSMETVRAKAASIGPADFAAAKTNPQIIWRFGRRGRIERSADGGATWTPQLSPVQTDLVAGSAPSETVCWLVGRNGTILRSIDGVNWQLVPSPKQAEKNGQPPDWNSVDARDASSAVIRTEDGRHFSTSDAGKTWQPQ